jgi:hypothetical protein
MVASRKSLGRSDNDVNRILLEDKARSLLRTGITKNFCVYENSREVPWANNLAARRIRMSMSKALEPWI